MCMSKTESANLHVIALCRIAQKYIALKAGLKNVVVFAGPAKFCSWVIDWLVKMLGFFDGEEGMKFSQKNSQHALLTFKYFLFSRTFTVKYQR